MYNTLDYLSQRKQKCWNSYIYYQVLANTPNHTRFHKYNHVTVFVHGVIIMTGQPLKPR